MSKLHELQEILLSDDRKRLNAFREHVEDQELRTEELARLLPEAIRRESERSTRLTSSLRDPIETGLNLAIRKNPDNVVNILYPIMAPAIRRSITEALKEMFQNINRTLDQSFSWRGLSWRLESLKTGVPFHEIVLKHTLLFRVRQLCLIQQKSGLLIRNITEEESELLDPDAASAMLTAIDDFAGDSFKWQLTENHLETVDLGEHSLWITHRGSVMLAGIIDGIAPPELRRHFADTLDEICRVAGEPLEQFDGDPEQIPAEVDTLLSSCLLSEEKETESSRRASPALLVAITILLGMAALLIYHHNTQENLERERQEGFQRLISELQLLPGISVIETERSETGFRVHAFQDPLAQDPTTIVSAFGFNDDDIDFHITPVFSLEPELVLKRTLRYLDPPETVSLTVEDHRIRATGKASEEWITQARIMSRLLAEPYLYDDSHLRSYDEALLEAIKKHLTPPDSAHLELDNGVLSLPGSASSQWIESIPDLLEMSWGVKNIDTTALQSSDELLLSTVRKRLDPPLSVNIHVEDAILTLGGSAPQNWIRSIKGKLDGTPGLKAIHSDHLNSNEIAEIEQLNERLSVLHIYYEYNDPEFTGQDNVIERIANLINRAAVIDTLIDDQIRVHILGFSDGDQTSDFNRHIAELRARNIAAILTTRHAVPHSLLALEAGSTKAGTEASERSLSKRRVDFRISIEKETDN